MKTGFAFLFGGLAMAYFANGPLMGIGAVILVGIGVLTLKVVLNNDVII